MTPAPTLQDLIRDVQHDAPDQAPLHRLETAAHMVQSMTDVGDAALGYFVDQARRSGHSWSEIGESLGVSKQAAQQRHVVRTGGLTNVTFERFTDRARRVVVRAQEEARLLDHNYIGTEHILLAQFSEPEGLAAQVLTEAGVSQESVRQAVRERVGEGPGTPEGHLPFTPRAIDVFTGALAAALELGHNYIGTEHLLFGIVRTEGLANEILQAAGLDEAALTPKIIAKLSGFQKAMPTKRAPRKPAAKKASPKR
ncbi:MAG: Clp protease N-terminal domain-containing protein [Acidimicrobiia bacterium]